jgi:hypothetical protein
MNYDANIGGGMESGYITVLQNLHLMEKVFQILAVFGLLMLVITYSVQARDRRFREYYFSRQIILPFPGDPDWIISELRRSFVPCSFSFVKFALLLYPPLIHILLRGPYPRPPIPLSRDAAFLFFRF